MANEAQKVDTSSSETSSALLLEKLRLLVIRERELSQLRQEYHHYSRWMECIQQTTISLSVESDVDSMLNSLLEAMVGQFPFETASIVDDGRLRNAGREIGQVDVRLLHDLASIAKRSREVQILEPAPTHFEAEGVLSWVMGGPVLSHDTGEVQFSVFVGRTERTDKFYRLPKDQEMSLFRQLLYAISHVYAAVSLRGELLAQRDHLASQIEKASLAERALAAEKKRLAVTLESIGDAVITTDVSGKVTSFNRAAGLMTGQSESDAIGRPFADVVRLRDETTGELRPDPVLEILDRHEIADVGHDTLLACRGGPERYVSLKGASLKDDEGDILGVVLVLHDTSELQRIHQERLRASKLESVGILAGGIAHDFNNILTAVITNLSLAVRMLEPADEPLTLVRDAERACLRAKDLTLQLLTFAKGGGPIRRTVSIVEAIKESSEFALRGSNVRCDITIADDLMRANVDVGQISQVIQNLVINADQAMPEGGVLTITAENVRELPATIDLAPGSYVKLSFRDGGVGIPLEILPKIFDPYFTTKEIGSGLGLATAYSIVNRHEGCITVESVVGEGTTFHVYLPAAPLRDKWGPSFHPSLSTGVGRILFMDDEAGVRRGAKRVLEYLGYNVECATDGSEALARYREARKRGAPFDLVIMDLTIPGGMGGRETIERLLEEFPDARAIVSSGYSNDPVMARYREHGFVGVVRKPFDLEALGRAVSEALADRSPPEGTR